MTKYIELIDKYEIRQSDSDEYNPPSYIWTDNTGELIRCKDCEHRKVYEMKGNTLALCNRLKTTMADAVEDNDYCSRAERKEE